MTETLTATPKKQGAYWILFVDHDDEREEKTWQVGHFKAEREGHDPAWWFPGKEGLYPQDEVAMYIAAGFITRIVGPIPEPDEE